MSWKRADILYVFGWLYGKKVFSHWEQAKGLSPGWILWYVFRWMDWEKVLLHQRAFAEDKSPICCIPVLVGFLEDPKRGNILNEEWLTHTSAAATWMKKQVFIFLSFRTSSLPFCLRLFMKNKLAINILAVKVHISVIIVIKITSQRIPWKNTWRNTRITGPDLHHGTIAIPALPRPLVVNLSVFSPPFSVTLRLTVLYILSSLGHMWENIPTYVCQLSLQQSHYLQKKEKSF